MSTNSPKPLKVQDGVIDIPPAQRINGAVYTGGWTCGPEQYLVTLQEFVTKLDRQKSTTAQYTIRCTAGLQRDDYFVLGYGLPSRCT